MPRIASKGSYALVYALVAFIVGVVLTAIAFRFSPTANSNFIGNSRPLQSETEDIPFEPSVSPIPELIGTPPIDERLARIDGAKTIYDTRQLSSRFDRNVALNYLLARSDESGVKQLIEESKSIDHISQRLNTLTDIFARFAAINPHETLTHINQFGPSLQQGFIYSIFREWSHSDLDAAVEAAKGLSAARREFAIEAILNTRDDLSAEKLSDLAENLVGKQSLGLVTLRSRAQSIAADPRAAWAEVVKNPATDENSLTKIMEVAFSWVHLEGTTALAEINDSLTDSRTRGTVLGMLVQYFGKSDPENILSFLEEIPQKDETKRLVTGLFRSWAETDAQAAFTSATDFDHENSTHKNREAVLRVWASRDPQAVLDLVDSLPPELVNSSLERAIASIAMENPTRAIAHLEDIENAPLKRKLTESVSKRWAEIDPKAAADWILSQPHRVANNKIKSSTVAKLVQKDLDLALKLAAAQQLNLAIQMELAIVRSIAETDIDKAIDVLPRITSANRVDSAARIGFILIRNDPQRAIDLGESLKENQRAGYFAQLISRWASREPFGLIGVLGDLPSKQMASNAAIRIIQQNWSSGDLTDAQLDHVYSHLNAKDRVGIDRFMRNRD